ncbi:MAG: phage major tail tube protein [Solibacillus sp.]
MNQLDQFLTNYAVWESATNWIGAADVELPSFEALTETLKGSGLAGEVNVPVKGHYGAQTLKINFRTLSPDAVRLSETKAHALDFRGSQQIFDAGQGIYIDQSVVVKTRCVPINFSPGKFSTGASTETANEFEVHYIKIIIGDKVWREFDKFNFVSIINGVDELATVRKNLGL